MVRPTTRNRAETAILDWVGSWEHSKDRYCPGVSTPVPASTPSPVTPSAGTPSAGTARRPSVGFLVLVGLVIAAAVAVRLVLLGRQSYWVDELFSVNESSGRFGTMLKVGSTEVHTPFYAGLLWAWIKVFGPHTVGTRLLSVVFAVLAVLVSYRGLRSVPVNDHVRWALTVATAASGTSIVYSLETRSYALLMLGSVGLTISTLRVALLTLAGEDVPRRAGLVWAGWVLLTATAHLFGAVLALAALVVLVTVTLVRGPGGKPRQILTWLVLAAFGCAPQAAWILIGLNRPGFAGGTDWIQAPDRSDLRDLLTTTFASGAVAPHKDGFAWASPIGVIVAAGLCLGAILYRYGWRHRPGWLSREVKRREAPSAEAPAAGAPSAGAPAREAPAREASTREGEAAAILLGLAAMVIVAVFIVSQRSHLWTLRNLVIITPALTWGVICLAAALAGTVTGRRAVATVVVALLGLGLVPMTIGLRHPYKSDFRGLLEYLISVRAEQPDAEYVFLGRDDPGPWKAAVDRAGDDPAWDTLYRHVARYRRANSYPAKASTSQTGTSQTGTVTRVVVYAHGVANPHLDRDAAALVARLGPSHCRRIPIYGLIVVRCD